jgi:hypothetical protein
VNEKIPLVISAKTNSEEVIPLFLQLDGPFGIAIPLFFFFFFAFVVDALVSNKRHRFSVYSHSFALAEPT